MGIVVVEGATRPQRDPKPGEAKIPTRRPHMKRAMVVMIIVSVIMFVFGALGVSTRVKTGREVVVLDGSTGILVFVRCYRVYGIVESRDCIVGRWYERKCVEMYLVVFPPE